MANILPVINGAVSVIENILPIISSFTPASVGSIINLVSSILPIAMEEASNLVQPIKNIITALQGNTSTTADQLATLAMLDAQCDAAFEAVAAADNIS